MERSLAVVKDMFELATDFYRESALCRALCQSLSLLACLLLLDGIVGFTTGSRMAYVLPLWLATKRGGRNAGATMVLIISVSLAAIDSATKGSNSNVLVNFVVQTLVLWGLMSIFDSLESKLRDVTTLATRDSLTGLLNRFAVEERAKKSIDRAMVAKQTLSVAMIDCDRFKELNDQFGHAYGDEVLRLLAKTMRRTLTTEAIFGRTGGDEFIVLLPNRDRAQAIGVLETMLDRFMVNTEIVGRSMGFSYGIAVVGEDSFEYSQLVQAADLDMYRRKGRRASGSTPLAS